MKNYEKCLEALRRERERVVTEVSRNLTDDEELREIALEEVEGNYRTLLLHLKALRENDFSVKDDLSRDEDLYGEGQYRIMFNRFENHLLRLRRVAYDSKTRRIRVYLAFDSAMKVSGDKRRRHFVFGE